MADIQLNRGGGGGGGQQSFADSDKFVLILHIFLITTEMSGNDKNDFLQTQRISCLIQKENTLYFYK